MKICEDEQMCTEKFFFHVLFETKCHSPFSIESAKRDEILVCCVFVSVESSVSRDSSKEWISRKCER